MTTREDWLTVLKRLRVQQCAYSKPDGEQATFCDCKFYQKGDLVRRGEERGNGCPELLWIMTHIEDMTEKEFERFSRWPLQRKKRRNKASLTANTV